MHSSGLDVAAKPFRRHNGLSGWRGVNHKHFCVVAKRHRQDIALSVSQGLHQFLTRRSGSR